MKILVTGADGYIGQGVVKKLLDHGVEVVATDFMLTHTDDRAIKIPGNIFEIDNCFEYFEKPDVLLHLAWRDGFKHNSSNHVNDFPRHYEFIKNMIEEGVNQVCILGSMHEIGFFEGCIDENTPTNPQSLYGISKNALRQCVELLNNNNDFIFQWIRAYYIVGNSEYGSSIFSKITQAARQGNKTFPFTLGKNQYDFIDYEELCEQIAAVVTQNRINGIINCCSGSPMSLGERVEAFITDNGFNIKLEYGAFPDRPYDSKAIWGNDNKIKRILNHAEVLGYTD